MKLAQPLRLGFESARANLVPMVVLWSLAAATVLSYYSIPYVAEALELVRVWQKRSGKFAAFANCAFFCGALPYIAYLCKGRSGPMRPFLTAALQSLFAGVCGVACNSFFHLQSSWFGCGHDVQTLIIKTVVDQFVWTVLVMVPATSFFYVLVGIWVEGSRTTTSFREYLQSDYFPNLIMGWCIWIPVIFIVYVFPQALQIQVLGFISAAWAIVCREIGARGGMIG